jgi:hypothetical protein
MQRVRALIVGIVIVSLTAGCTYIPTRSLEYTPTAISPTHPQDAVLVVRNLAEARGERVYSSSFGRMFLTYIPMVPYVKIPYERLDESDQMHRGLEIGPDRGDSHFTVAMSEVISSDLAASGLFREVRYIGNDPIPPDADYVLVGKLESTEFDVYATSYMLGMVGVLLWILPLPIGKNKATVGAYLRLLDRSGQQVWAGELKGEGSRIFTLYNSNGAPVTNSMMLEIKRYSGNDAGIDGDSLWAYHAAALRSGMKGVKESMSAYFDANPGRD